MSGTANPHGGKTPPAEVEIDESLVARLVAEQHPDLAGETVRYIAAGWDNELYRLGDHHVVRVPRRQLGADLVEHEHVWLPKLAPTLPLPISAPVFAGGPSAAFRWHWSICPWFEGAPASEAPLANPVDDARRLGRFLAALHRPAPADAPLNPHRGQPLADRDAITRERAAALADLIDSAAVLAAWDRARATTPWDGPPIWLHADLHPGNVIVHNGQIAAVVDFGDICGGDPATDLVIAWSLFDDAARSEFRRAVDVDIDTWERGRGWAITHSLAVLSSSADNPAYMTFGLRSLAAATAAGSDSSA